LVRPRVGWETVTSLASGLAKVLWWLVKDGN
jgi:hypothetical protein